MENRYHHKNEVTIKVNVWLSPARVSGCGTDFASCACSASWAARPVCVRRPPAAVAAHGSSATAVRSSPPLPAPHVSFTLWMPVRFIPPDLNLASHQGYLSKSKFPLISSHKTWLLRTSQWVQMLRGWGGGEGPRERVERARNPDWVHRPWAAWSRMLCGTALSSCS